MGKHTGPTLEGLKEHIRQVIRARELDVESREDLEHSDEHSARRSECLIRLKKGLEKWQAWEQIILNMENNQQNPN